MTRSLFTPAQLDPLMQPVTYPDPPSVPVSTSEAAAEAIKPSAARQRMEVLNYLVSCGERGATRQEIEVALEMSGNSVRPRVKELLEPATGASQAVETERKRKTTSGRDAVVIVAAQFAGSERSV